MGDNNIPLSKTKAERNSWYSLATLYGVDRVDQNRDAWNIYVASFLNEIEFNKIKKEHKMFGELSFQGIHSLVDRVKADFKGNFPSVNLPDPMPSAINFSHIEFDQAFVANGFLFPFKVSFFGSVFMKTAKLSGGLFLHNANFSDVRFHGQADFEGTAFSKLANFERTYFQSSAHFKAAVFMSRSEFELAEFHSTVSFSNAKFDGPASFKSASFLKYPPAFYNADIHEGTVWGGNNWPVPKSKDDAAEFIKAYGRLKKEADHQKCYEDELDFFALELESSLLLHKSVPIYVYRITSNYGRSYVRPIILMATAVVIPWFIYVIDFMCKIYDGVKPAIGIGRLFCLSVANTFSLFGFRKDFFDSSEIIALSGLLQFVAGLQTLVGAASLFLLGLAARNHFRMK